MYRDKMNYVLNQDAIVTKRAKFETSAMSIISCLLQQYKRNTIAAIDHKRAIRINL